VTNNFTDLYDNILSTPPSAGKKFTPESELAFLGWSNGCVPQSTRDLFDDFVDSSLVHMRKPEPGIYLLACKRNGLRPEEVVMLDDLGPYVI
jgi:HAD superfamily hydrolase (TIGR01509 family)